MAKNWIKDAMNPANKGKLRRALGAKKDETISERKLATAVKKKGVTGARARLAMTLASFSKNKKGPTKKK